MARQRRYVSRRYDPKAATAAKEARRAEQVWRDYKAARTFVAQCKHGIELATQSRALAKQRGQHNEVERLTRLITTQYEPKLHEARQQLKAAKHVWKTTKPRHMEWRRHALSGQRMLVDPEGGFVESVLPFVGFWVVIGLIAWMISLLN